MPASRNAQRGFGVIELILAVTVVALLAAFGYSRMSRNESVAKEATEETAETIAARDAQLCAISKDYCPKEERRDGWAR